MSLAFSPFLPWSVLVALGAVGIAAAALRLKASLSGAALRLLTVFLLIGFLAGPERKEAEEAPLDDVALVIVDESRSTSLGGRDVLVRDAAARVIEEAERLGVEVRTTVLRGEAETALAPALTAALSSVPRARLSGILVVTDGQLTEVPDAASLGLAVPLHALLAGDPASQRDRRVRITSAPRYGVVGEAARIAFIVEDDGESSQVEAALSLNGEVLARARVSPGREVTLTVPLDMPGEAVVEVAVPSVPGELTTRNNRAGVQLRAVRDRLRVLLISGEPHAGERVWRNTLKSDPAVDLVHFTILKPMDKDARAYQNDLNLIPFPHEELFLEKLQDFDVVIFDRYTYRGVLRSYEFEAIAQYARGGGAVLVSSGPEFAGTGSLADRRSLAHVLPVLPAGRALDTPFVPMLSEAGKRHPVTSALSEDGAWGRWLRVVPGEVQAGTSLMKGPRGEPLLVLSRTGQGRVAMLMSDHVWLWARGFDGGGPYGELLRRMVHWLMQEPALEEEALRARLTAEGTLVAERRSLEDAPAPVTVEAPDGSERSAAWRAVEPGLFRAELPASDAGFYRVRSERMDGEPLFAVAALGEAAPPETDAVVTTDTALRPLAEATGGGVFTLRSGRDIPVLRRVAEGRSAAGGSWAGLVQRDAVRVLSLRTAPLVPRWAWLSAILLMALGAWLVEGRRGASLRGRQPRSR